MSRVILRKYSTEALRFLFVRRGKSCGQNSDSLGLESCRKLVIKLSSPADTQKKVARKNCLKNYSYIAFFSYKATVLQLSPCTILQSTYSQNYIRTAFWPTASSIYIRANRLMIGGFFRTKVQLKPDIF